MRVRMRIVCLMPSIPHHHHRWGQAYASLPPLPTHTYLERALGLDAAEGGCGAGITGHPALTCEGEGEKRECEGSTTRELPD